VGDASPHPITVKLVERLVGRQRREVGLADGLENCELAVELLEVGNAEREIDDGFGEQAGTEVEPMCSTRQRRPSVWSSWSASST